MRNLIIGLGLTAGLFAGAASAAPSMLAQAFGATIVSTYPDGRTAELWLQASGTYNAEGRRGDMSSGHWKVKGGKLCLSQSHPIPVPFTYCTAIPPAEPNATWTAKAVTGEPIRVKLVKGHVAGHPRSAQS